MGCQLPGKPIRISGPAFPDAVDHKPFAAHLATPFGPRFFAFPPQLS